MKITKPQIIVGSIVVAIFGYWMYNRYQSKKAIEKVKDDELSKSATTSQIPTTPEIPKMFIRAGVNVPAGAMSFVDDK